MDDVEIPELRFYERFRPKKDIVVALHYPAEESEKYQIGKMVDMSQSGLALSYLALDASVISASENCTVSILELPMKTQPIQCRVVYEKELPAYSFLDLPMKRVGLEFGKPLPTSEIETMREQFNRA